MGLQLLLYNLLAAEVRSKVGSENLYPGTGTPITGDWIDYSALGSHPEFVLRATRMLILSHKLDGHDGFLNQIEGFARGLRASESSRPSVSEGR